MNYLAKRSKHLLLLHIMNLCPFNLFSWTGQSPSMSSIAHSSHMDIFQNLAVDLETEGRYLFLNCIANQLRYVGYQQKLWIFCRAYGDKYSMKKFIIAHSISSLQVSKQPHALLLVYLAVPLCWSKSGIYSRTDYSCAAREANR